MLSIDELEEFLIENSADLSWDHNEQEGTLRIRSEKWKEIIKLDLKQLHKFTIPLIKLMLEHGKNVIKIARVTGYFSHTTYWNPGKMAELRDRFRINKIKLNTQGVTSNE